MSDWLSGSSLIKLIGGLAILWYYVSLFYVGLVTPEAAPSPDGLRQFMALSITTISGTLATFVGMAFGFQQVQAKAQANTAAQKAIAAVQLTSSQTIAAFCYILSLVVSLVMWAVIGNGIDAVVQTVARSFLGLVGGALAVVLNVRT